MNFTRPHPVLATCLRFGCLLALVVALGTIPGLPATAPSLTQAATTSQTAAELAASGRAGGGTTKIGPGTTIRIPTLSGPPAVPAGVASRPHPEARVRVPSSGATDAAVTTSAPSAPATILPAVSNPAPGTGSPDSLVVAANTSLGAVGGNTSPDDETTAVNDGNDVFVTGNFYDALSTDGGHTFAYVDPYSAFPASYNGFCCNQQTLFVPGSNLTFWALEYIQDANNNNEIRLAVAQGADGLASNTWTYWDFTASDASLPPGLWLDYPQLAYSSNDLYLTATALNPDATIQSSVVFRCPLSSLAAPSNGTLPCTSFYLTGADTFTPVNGATSTMYWADHLNNHTLQVFYWPEDQDWPGVGWRPVGHSAFPATGFSCPSPDGRDMCGSDSWTVRGGWLNGGVLGFMWDAAQGSGGLGSFPYPYVHVVEINLASFGLIDEPIIWSNTAAWAYAAAALNGGGTVGVNLAYSGGGNYPGSAVMVRDPSSPSSWQALNLAEGTNGPPQNRWGDFLAIRPDSGNGMTWVAAGYTLQGSCDDNWGPCGAVQPRFYWFGLEGNATCLPVVNGQAIAPPRQVEPRRSTTTGSILYLPIVPVNSCAS